MIINFSVQNFCSIKQKQTLSLEANKSTHLEEYYIIEPIKGLRLNKLALIYGANASGKTTVLKALDFLRKISTDPFDKKTQTFDFEPFLFDENTPNQNTIFELEFVQNGIRYFYEVELNKRCIVKEKLLNFNPNKAVVFERTTDEKKELTSIKFGSKILKKKHLEESLEIFTLWNNTVLGASLKANIDNFELIECSNWFLEKLCNVLYSSIQTSRDFTIDLVQKGLLNNHFFEKLFAKADFNINKIIIKDKKIRVPKGLNENSKFVKKTEVGLSFEMLEYDVKDVLFVHEIGKKKYHLNINYESEGTKKYFDLMAILYLILSTDCILSLDELESSLHPDLFNHFLLTYLVNGKKESQLIATTHNREILNNKDLFRDDAIWFTDKNEEAATQLYSLADFGSDVVRDTTNVLNAYKSGKLGGVPNLGDYYIDLEDE